LSLLDICRFIAGEHCAFQLLLRLIPGVLVEDGGPFSYDESTKNLILRLGGIGVVSLQSLPRHHCRAWRCCATTLAGLLFGITHNMVFPSPSLLIPPCVYCRAQGLFTSCTMSSARLFLVGRERCEVHVSALLVLYHGSSMAFYVEEYTLCKTHDFAIAPFYVVCLLSFRSFCSNRAEKNSRPK
jgi:hypothetical protein